MLQQFLPLTYHLYLLARSPIDLSSGASETMHRPQKVTDVAAIIQLFQSADIPFEHQDPDSLFLLSPAHGPLEDLCAMTEIDQSLFTLFPPLPQGPSTPFLSGRRSKHCSKGLIQRILVPLGTVWQAYNKSRSRTWRRMLA